MIAFTQADWDMGLMLAMHMSTFIIYGVVFILLEDKIKKGEMTAFWFSAAGLGFWFTLWFIMGTLGFKIGGGGF